MALFDLHVHAAPDIIARRYNDDEIADIYNSYGYDGFVLKGHYDATASRALLLGSAGSTQAFGGLVLNGNVGGFNPTAVAAALALGARVIWLPTTDSASHAQAGLPRLCHQEERISQSTFAAPPIDPSSAHDLQLILQLIASADALLATGHLSAEEVAWVLPQAQAVGVKRILLTHPCYTVPAMSPATASVFTGRGAYAEITAYQLLHQPGVTAASLAEFIRVIGLDRVVLSSDAGQLDSPSPPVALEHLIDALVGEGLDRSALRSSASDIPAALVIP